MPRQHPFPTMTSDPFRLFLLCALSVSTFAAQNRLEKNLPQGGGTGVAMDWIAFPHPQLEVRGLPWFTENSPELWRLPK